MTERLERLHHILDAARREVGKVILGQNEVIDQALIVILARQHALVEGVDAIVHLGGVSVERPFEEILPANIQGTYNIYEAARRHGVRRVVFASSNHVIGYYRQGEGLDADTPARPDGYYGVSKLFEIGRAHV